jgi:hypothetical protein
MGQIPLPKRFHPDFSRPGVKPTSPVVLDLDNSIAKRIRLAVLPGGINGLRELALGQNLTVAGNRDIIGSALGQVQDFDGTSDYLQLSNNDHYVPGESGVFILSTFDGPITGTDRVLFEKDFTSASEPFYTYRIIHSRTGGAPELGAQWNQGGTRRFLVGGSFAPTIGVPFVTALSIKEGAQALYAGDFRDRVALQQSSSHSGAIVNYDTPLRIGSSELFTQRHSGPIYLVLIVEGGFTEAEVQSLASDPYQVFKPAVPQTYFIPEAGGGPTYTLATASGSFSYSGTSLSLSASRKIAAGSGTYSYTGTAVDLTYTPVGGPTYTLALGSAAYSYDGTALSLTAQRTISAGSGAYSYQGTSIAFEYTRRLLAESGTYSYTGTSIAFKASRGITLETAVFTYSGTDVKLTLPSELWQYSGNVTTDWQPMNNSTTSWAEQPIMTTTWTKES